MGPKFRAHLFIVQKCALPSSKQHARAEASSLFYQEPNGALTKSAVVKL